jgi:hypothetical protein
MDNNFFDIAFYNTWLLSESTLVIVVNLLVNLTARGAGAVAPGGPNAVLIDQKMLGQISYENIYIYANI